MYDALTARYTFACPRREQAHVALSSFRLLERLPGAAHPAVYEVRFDCSCGDEHPGLVSHEDLDWAPLGGHAGAFVDLMTSRIRRRRRPSCARPRRRTCRRGSGRGASTATRRDARGRSFRPRSSPSRPASAGSGSPSAARSARRCRSISSRRRTSTSRSRTTSRIGVVDHVFPDDALRTVEAFRAELDSSRFDERRLHLN